MTKTIDIELQKQLDKPQTWFCKYFPARIRNVGEREIADRQLVFDFKDGRAYEEVARRTATAMTERYGATCADIVFSPVPASTREKNEIRYKASAKWCVNSPVQSTVTTMYRFVAIE